MNKPLGDFANYYYGSKCFIEGKNLDSLYTDIHWFNEQISSGGEKYFFGNYIPVPPFSLLFYAPFTLFTPQSAKIIFNVLGLLCFCISLKRFTKSANLKPQALLISLPLLFFPFYNNFLQGQSYILLTALILEIYTLYLKRQTLPIAFCVSLLFHLKLFPAFLLLYFISRKEYKIFIFSILIIAALMLLTGVAIGTDTLSRYFLEIVPRLLKNEIVDPFYYGHQGWNVLLKELFVYDALNNPSPVFNFPVLASLLEGAGAGAILYFCFRAVRENSPDISFGLFIFSGVLMSRYTTSYSLVMLLPLVTNLFSYRRVILIFLLFLPLLNVPLALVETAPVLIKYFRIIGMTVIFMLVINELKPEIIWLQIIAFCSIFLLVHFLMYSPQENNYYFPSEKHGVHYQFKVSGNNIILRRCLGDTDVADTLLFPGKINTAEKLDINRYKSYPDNGDRKKPEAVLINNSELIYLSDRGQGVGMYKLRIITVK